jgi:mono/diheme cytochrome c family protein
MRVSAPVLAILGVASVSALTASAAPRTYELPDEAVALRPGPGLEVAENNCKACHSADYINFQPPKKGQAFWEAEVQKMIKVYHAPISEADAKIISDYLAKTY